MFINRTDAGRKLAARLLAYKDQSPIVFALPRGGVPVAFEVARELNAPLDIIVVRKIGAPGQHELGIGALADGDHPETVLNEDLIAMIDVSQEYLRREIRLEVREARRREELYRGGQAANDVKGRMVIVVDDGIATGGTMRAALRSVRRRGAKRVVLAIPVAPADTVAELRREVDDVVCLEAPRSFGAIGEFYEDFGQTSDGEVISILGRARTLSEKGAPPEH